MFYSGLICLALSLLVAGISPAVESDMPAQVYQVYWVLTVAGMLLLVVHAVRWRPLRPF